MTVGPTLAVSLEPLSHCRNVLSMPWGINPLSKTPPPSLLPSCPLLKSGTVQALPFLGNSPLYIGFSGTLPLKIGFFSEPP